MLEFLTRDAVRDRTGNGINLGKSALPNPWAIDGLTPEQEAAVDSAGSASFVMGLLSILTTVVFEKFM